MVLPIPNIFTTTKKYIKNVPGFEGDGLPNEKQRATHLLL